MDRPGFDNIKDFSEFSKYYWYRDELIKICKAHGLKAPSSKIELNEVIEAYFSRKKIVPDKKAVSRKITLGDLLDIYYGKKTYAIYDRSALQWNSL